MVLQRQKRAVQVECNTGNTQRKEIRRPLDPFSIISATWWLGPLVAFLMGLILSLNPAAWPVLGAAVGVGASGELAGARKGVKLGAAFSAGLLISYIFVGVFAASVSKVTAGFLRPYAGIGYLVLGTALLAMGAWLLFKPDSFCTACTSGSKRRFATLGAAFAAGVPAGFVNCPACSGVVLGIATSSAELGSGLYSTAVMTSLGLGHGAALVAATYFVTKGWRPQGRWGSWAKAAAGISLMAMAAYFLFLVSIEGLAPRPKLV